MRKFIEHIDVGYSLYVTERLRTFISNPDLGFRTSGSTAEKEAAEFILQEYTKIGLSNCRKEKVTVDTFEFKKGELQFEEAKGTNVKVNLAAFQTNCHAENEPIEIIYVNKGTETDYDGIEAENKYLLIDIDMMNDWWVNWPLCQAREKKAKGIIVSNVAGYCSYAEDCLGTQDIYGPADTPAFSISVSDANRLKKAIAQNGGNLKAILNADSTVENNGFSYCVIGEIPGKTDEVIYLIGHYDAYFRAFDDNTAGIGCVLGIVKAFVESGYKPNRTLRVICHGAEEWGVENSKYDWARGAWVLTQNHPEWCENGFALVNIDSSTINSTASKVQIRTCYEMASAIEEFGKTIEGKAHEIETNTPIWTWTESIMYNYLGIPTIESFYKDVNFWGSYHSTYDLKEVNSYTDEEYRSSHIIYGSYLQIFDEIGVRPFDYTVTFEKFAESLRDYQLDNRYQLVSETEKALEAAQNLKDYDVSKLKEDEVRIFNKKISYLFRYMTKKLYGINWAEEFDFAHIRYMNNVNNLKSVLSALESGEMFSAVKDKLAEIDLTYYMYYFDKETCDFLREQIIGENVTETWATGLVETETNLWDIVRSLMKKEKQGVMDLKEETEAIREKLKEQEILLNAKADRIILSLAEAKNIMEALI